MDVFLIRLAFFIAFAFYTFSSYAGDSIPQLEEGFRWKDKCHLVMGGTGYSDEAPQAEHLEMNKIESALSHHVPRTCMHCNIALARISIVFRDASGTIKRVSDWVRWCPEGGGFEEVAVFVSGQENALASVGGRIAFAADQTLPIQEVNGTNVINLDNFKGEVHSLFMDNTTRNLDDSIRRDRLDETRPTATLVALDYHHSEQWIMIYLGLDRGPERNQKPIIFHLVDNLIPQARTVGYNDRTTTPILAVILHIHSKNDLCDRCTHSLSQFPSKPKGTIARLKRYVKENYQPAWGSAEPAFLIVASSRINSQNRRVFYGHDYRFADPIDISAFPPWFVQIALPDLPRPQRPLVRLQAHAPVAVRRAAAASFGGGGGGGSGGGGTGGGTTSGTGGGGGTGRGAAAAASLPPGDGSHPSSGSGDDSGRREGEIADEDGEDDGDKAADDSGIAAEGGEGGPRSKETRRRGRSTPPERTASTAASTPVDGGELVGSGEGERDSVPPTSRRRTTTTSAAAAILAPPATRGVDDDTAPAAPAAVEDGEGGEEEEGESIDHRLKKGGGMDLS